MYIDLIILILIILLVAFTFKRYHSFVFIIAIIDIFLRLLTFIKQNIPTNSLTIFLNNYVPNNIFSIINSYTTGILNTILKWAFVFIMFNFLYYIVKIFLKKKRKI